MIGFALTALAAVLAGLAYLHASVAYALGEDERQYPIFDGDGHVR